LRLVPGGRLDLRIDPGVFAPGLVEALNELQFFLQRRDFKRAVAFWEALFEYRFAGLVIESLRYSELLQLGKGEVDRVKAAVSSFATWETPGHIGDRVEVNIVEHQGNAIFAQDKILFQIMRIHRVGHRDGLQSVFGQISTGATMGNDNLLRIGHRGKSSTTPKDTIPKGRKIAF